MNRFIVCGALGFLVALGAGPVRAQTASPSVLNEDAGATTGLGDSHRFHSFNQAMLHCSDDVIVWSDGVNLTYVLPGKPGYGQGGHGFYACQMEADDAGFHQTD